MMEADASSEVHISLPWKWRPFKRHRLPNSEFFADGDEVLRVARKLIPLETSVDDEAGDPASHSKQTFPCGVPGCVQTFTSLLSYENHYNSLHRHTCSTCHRTFPSSFLLDIHLQEQHDSLFTVLAARQNMYQCLVEQCEEKFATPGERREHLIKVHKYPPNFRFHRDPAPTHRKKQSTKQAAKAMDVDHPPSTHSTDTSQSTASDPDLSHSLSSDPDTNHSPRPGSSSDKENTVAMETPAACGGEKEGSGLEVEAEGEIKKAAASKRVFVHKVPANFSFGHGVARGFQRPAGKQKKKNKGGHWHQKVGDGAGITTTDITNVDMTDMAEALNDV